VLVEAFDNDAHSSITASVGTVEDPTAVAAAFDLTNGANVGKTVLGTPGSMATFLAQDISNQTLGVKFVSTNNLDTLIAGRLQVQLFYTNP
jgi:hypothetical protein